MRVLKGREEIREFLNSQVVLIDYRESCAEDCMLAIENAVEVVDLESDGDRGAGDYAFKAGELYWGIEHKTVGDWLNSVTSGRLEEQLAAMFDVYDGVVLCVSGEMSMGKEDFVVLRRWSEEKWGKYRVWKLGVRRTVPLQLSLQKHGVDVVWYGKEENTPEVVSSIIRYLRGSHEALLRRWARPKPIIYSTEPMVRKLIEMWKGVSEAVAEEAIRRYKTPWNVLHTSPEELLDVAGVGRVMVERLFSGVGKEVTWQGKERSARGKAQSRKPLRSCSRSLKGKPQ